MFYLPLELIQPICHTPCFPISHRDLYFRSQERRCEPPKPEPGEKEPTKFKGWTTTNEAALPQKSDALSSASAAFGAGMLVAAVGALSVGCVSRRRR